MKTLSQLLAVEAQTKSSSTDQITALYHLIQKEALLSGISRTYRPIDEEGEKLPAESTQVQVRVKQVLRDVGRVMTPLYDLTLAKDMANQEAIADVEVDGQIILTGVPATYLLWLEKKLQDLHTVIVKLPTLPQGETWSEDPTQDAYVTPVTETTRTKKTPRAFVKYEATKEHPAQVEVVQEDRLVGIWSTTKYSGALPVSKVQELRERIEKLMAAVKVAREKANLVPVEKPSAGAAVFSYLLAGI